MKKSNLILLLVFFCGLFFMNFTSTMQINDNSTIIKNSLTVKVVSDSGKGMKGVRIVGEVCGGISCLGQTKPVYTDSDGYATIVFSDGCRLCDIFVDGNSNEGTYKDGGSYKLYH